MCLPRDLGNQFEVAVVVQHGEPACFSGGGDESVDEGKGPMPASVCQDGLDFQCPLVFGIPTRKPPRLVSLKTPTPSRADLTS